MHDHHTDSGAEAAGAASWLIAMVLFVIIAVAVIIALFAWAPWESSGTRNTIPNNNVPQASSGANNNPLSTNR